MKTHPVFTVIFLAASIARATITVPVSANPNYTASINPNYTASINPTYSASINPKYTASIDPKYTASINPTYTASINPKYTASINPTYTASINPTYTVSINPNYSSWQGYFVWDTDCNLLGIFVFAGTKNLNFFTTSGNWTNFASNNSSSGYNFFDLSSEWVGYLASNGAGNFNYFDIDGNWLGFTTTGSGSSIGGGTPTAHPDLIIDSLAAAFIDDTLWAVFILANTGTATASAGVTCALYENDSLLWSFSPTTSALAANYYLSYYYYNENPTRGNVTIRVCADASSSITESSETNNCSSTSIFVPPATGISHTPNNTLRPIAPATGYYNLLGRRVPCTDGQTLTGRTHAAGILVRLSEEAITTLQPTNSSRAKKCHILKPR